MIRDRYAATRANVQSRAGSNVVKGANPTHAHMPSPPVFKVVSYVHRRIVAGFGQAVSEMVCAFMSGIEAATFFCVASAPPNFVSWPKSRLVPYNPSIQSHPGAKKKKKGTKRQKKTKGLSAKKKKKKKKKKKEKKTRPPTAEVLRRQSPYCLTTSSP